MKKQIIYAYDAQDMKLIRQENIGPRATAKAGYTEAYDKFVQEQESKLIELDLVAQRDAYVELMDAHADMVDAMARYKEATATLATYGLSVKTCLADIAKNQAVKVEVCAANFIDDAPVVKK